jgi:hypothetical protein
VDNNQVTESTKESVEDKELHDVGIASQVAGAYSLPEWFSTSTVQCVYFKFGQHTCEAGL